MKWLTIKENKWIELHGMVPRRIELQNNQEKLNYLTHKNNKILAKVISNKMIANTMCQELFYAVYLRKNFIF